MATPPYVPVAPDQVPRRGDLQDFPPPRRPIARPAEITGPQPRGPGLGTPTPDAGYALLLARRLTDRIQLADRERLDDALWAGAIVGMKGAGLVGRGPILADVELGLALLGYLGGASDDMVAWRQHTLFGVERDYHLQRALADRVGPDLLGRAPADVATLLGDWKAIFAGLPGVPIRSSTEPVAQSATASGQQPPPASPRRRPRVAARPATRTGHLRRLASRRHRPVAATTTPEERT